jgi:hypothetical protein
MIGIHVSCKLRTLGVRLGLRMTLVSSVSVWINLCPSRASQPIVHHYGSPLPADSTDDCSHCHYPCKACFIEITVSGVTQCYVLERMSLKFGLGRFSVNLCISKKLAGYFSETVSIYQIPLRHILVETTLNINFILIIRCVF